jgi:hypothetical protein
MDNTMYDVDRKCILVGDRVAYAIPGYTELNIGTVVGFSPLKVRILPSNGRGHQLKFPNQLAVVV